MSLKLSVILLGAFALVSSVFAQYPVGAPWPRDQQNNSATSLGVGEGSNGMTRWVIPSGYNFCNSTLVGADGTMYAASMDGVVYAANPNGTQQWVYATAADSFCGAPALAADGTLYAVGSSGTIYHISATGTLLWSVAYDDTFIGSPAIGPGGLIYFVGQNGNLDAINAAGTPQWTQSTGDILNGCPAIDALGNIYVCGVDGGIYTFGSDGTPGWTTQIGGTETFLCCPSIGSDGTVYAIGTSGTIYTFSSSGVPGWTYLCLDGAISPLSIGADGSLYEVGVSGDITAVSSAGVLEWTVPITDNFENSASIGGDGTLYIPSDGGTVYTFSALGTPGWTYATGESFGGSAAIGADGTVFIVSTTGDVIAIGAPNAVSSVSLSPSIVIGGIGSTGTVTLQSAATGLGWVVNLSSSSSNVTVPSSVTVQPGNSTATFPITTTQPLAPLVATISASDAYALKSAPLTVYEDYVVHLALSPPSVGGGGTSTGTVSIYEPAPSDGYTVELSSQFPSSVGVPASVTIQPGQTSADFTITTGQFSNTFYCDIYAADGTSGTQATLQVVGDTIASVNGLTISPGSIGCNQTATGTITLTSMAPSAGWVVNLSTEYPSSVSVPATVTVPAGATTATFTITPLKQFSNTFLCDVYATDGGSAAQAGVSVVGDSLFGLSFSPASVVGGTTSTGTITLTSAAPSGGWIVNVSTQYPTTDTVPSTVFVAADSTTATFTITTKTTGTTYGCGVYISDGVSGKQATLTITPS